MAPLRTYLLPAALAVAAVQATSIEEYIPKCAPKCVYTAVDENSTCEKDDNACLCRDIYSLKLHSEPCIQKACSDAEFGEPPLPQHTVARVMTMLLTKLDF